MWFVARACDCQNRAVDWHGIKGSAIVVGWEMLEGRGRVPDFEFRGHINMADSKACRKGPSLKRKIEIIQEVERHPTKLRKIIAEEFNIAPSTLATILTAKEKYKSHYFGGEDTAACQKMRCAQHEDIEKELLEWQQSPFSVVS